MSDRIMNTREGIEPIAALAALLLVAACATSVSRGPSGPAPSFVEPSPLPREASGVALVLSGGGARGFAHVGVIKVLEANGMRPDIVVGSSAGSIVGALYASGMSPAELERAVGDMGFRDFNDLVLPGLGLLPGAMGVVRGDKLHRFIDDRALVHRIENFPMRFAAVATDLGSGRTQIFNSGDVGIAVLASSALPGIIAPAEIGGRYYGDGQVTSPLPVDAARRLGARVVVAVDVVYPPEDASLRSAVGILFQAYAIAINRIRDFEAVNADVVIVPELPRTSGQFSFGDRERLIAAGERAAIREIDRLRPLFKRQHLMEK